MKGVKTGRLVGEVKDKRFEKRKEEQRKKKRKDTKKGKMKEEGEEAQKKKEEGLADREGVEDGRCRLSLAILRTLESCW